MEGRTKKGKKGKRFEFSFLEEESEDAVPILPEQSSETTTANSAKGNGEEIKSNIIPSDNGNAETEKNENTDKASKVPETTTELKPTNNNSENDTVESIAKSKTEDTTDSKVEGSKKDNITASNCTPSTLSPSPSPSPSSIPSTFSSSSPYLALPSSSSSSSSSPSPASLDLRQWNTPPSRTSGSGSFSVRFQLSSLN